MRTTKKIRCASCGKKIPKYEPDVVLEDLATGKKRFYHERCSAAAYRSAYAARPSVGSSP